MKNFLLKTIDFYQNHLSSRKIFFKNSCVFIPSCSEYTKEAVIKYGGMKGLYFATRRILRCHPWQKNHYDPLK